jgi:isocitrate/isopropylmalate dehydrogenase
MSGVRKHSIAVIPGDGIGPEQTEATLEVLRAIEKRAANIELVVAVHEAGAGQVRRTGRSMSEETMAACKAADGVIKGPVGHPDVRNPDGTEAGVLGGVLRPALDAYANLRPVRLYPGVRSALADMTPGAIDYLVVRENTEGLYASRGRGFVTHDLSVDNMVMTRKGIERVCRRAYELARGRNGAPRDRVKRVTCVDKANVLRGFAFFREIFLEIGKDFPDIQAECIYSDAAAAKLVQNPGHFDVLVMENFLGDLLSDLGAGTIGGLGMCPSGNIGDDKAYFEPIHGSAPDIAGQDKANPISMVLSAAMMLDWLDEPAAAARVRDAVDGALKDGQIVLRPDGSVVGGTRAAGRALVARLS